MTWSVDDLQELMLRLVGHTAKIRGKRSYTEQNYGWSVHVRLYIVLVVRCTFGSRAEIVLSVHSSFDEGNLLAFKSLSTSKFVDEQTPNNSRYQFALCALCTLCMCASHSPVVLFIRHLVGACSLFEQINRWFYTIVSFQLRYNTLLQLLYLIKNKSIYDLMIIEILVTMCYIILFK